MAWSYGPRGPFVDVPDPKNPPPGAVEVDAAYLNGVEDALVSAASESGSYAKAADVPSVPADIGAATSAQGALADSAVQPADLGPYALLAGVPGVRVDTSVGTRVFVTPAGGSEVRVHADTGWRDVTGDLLNGWGAISVRVSRVNERVYFSATGIDGSAANDDRVIAMVTGFMSQSFLGLLPTNGTSPGAAVGGAWQVMSSFSGGYLRAQTSVTNDFLETSWYTADPWPTILPGVPA